MRPETASGAVEIESVEVGIHRPVAGPLGRGSKTETAILRDCPGAVTVIVPTPLSLLGRKLGFRDTARVEGAVPLVGDILSHGTFNDAVQARVPEPTFEIVTD